MSGYWAMGRPKSAMAPARVTKMDSTDAKIGRLMKKLVNTVHLPLCATAVLRPGLRRLTVAARRLNPRLRSARFRNRRDNHLLARFSVRLNPRPPVARPVGRRVARGRGPVF